RRSRTAHLVARNNRIERRRARGGVRRRSPSDPAGADSVHLLAAPVDAQMEEDAMEIIQLLITGPADEANLYECLGGATFVHSLNGDIQPAVVQKAVTHHEVDDYVDQSMLGMYTEYAMVLDHLWWYIRRYASIPEVEVPVELLGRQYTCKSKGGKCTSRKNNDHWTEDEMEELLDGVSKKGIGKWSKVKECYFSLSIRTVVHLKDKWRNLMRACKAKKTYKKKVNIQKATEYIVRKFRHRISYLGHRSQGSWQKKETNQSARIRELKM
ncbi:hypothetical protein U9M48_009317, partial [Paspalum notatum var. saurae]